MSSFLATTRVVVQSSSGDTTDPTTGDPIPAEGWTAKDFPASIIEKSKVITDPSSGEMRTVRYAVGRVRSTVPVEQGDRVKDVRSGKVWLVDEKTGGDRSLSGARDVRLDLRVTS